MNNIFSAKRFGKYFSYDLKHSTDTYGLSLLISGLMPVITFFFASVICRIATGGWVPDNTVNRTVAISVAIITTIIIFPTKVYGDITDKRMGTTFLMVPSSTFEKWLSAALITLVIVPLALLVLLLGSDLVLGLLFPSHYGKALLLYEWFRPVINIPAQMSELPVDLSLNVGLMLWTAWATSSLSFLLGAVFFKKSKIAKTILTIVLVSVAVSLLLAPLTPFASGIASRLVESDPLEVAGGMRIAVWTIDTLEIIAFLAVLYWRFRTIKH